jgi:hypothetical protein
MKRVTRSQAAARASTALCADTLHRVLVTPAELELLSRTRDRHWRG